MSENQSQSKMLAQTVYEIRLLLSDYLGSKHEGDPLVRQAAHLAYALHNEALSTIEGRSFDTSSAVMKIEAVDKMLGQSFTPRFKAHL